MNSPIVVKFGGSVLDSIMSKHELWHVLGSAHAARPVGAGLIVCHGGGRSVDAHLEALGLTTQKRDGVRITPPEQIEAVVGVLAGVLNTQLVAALRACGIQAVGVTLADAGTVAVGLEDRLGPGLGLVGRVTCGDGSLFGDLLRAGYVPVVASIGSDGDGQLLNVNADDAAEGVAASVDAQALILLTDVPGVVGADGDVIPCLTVDEVPGLIASGVVSGGMAAKVRAASASAERLGRPVLIGHERDADLLVSNQEGCGTRIEPSRVRTQPTGTHPVGLSHENA